MYVTRLAPAALIALCALMAGVFAEAAHAEDWVIVVDADEVDATKPEALPAPLPALVAQLAKRDKTVRLLAARHPLVALTSALPAAPETSEDDETPKEGDADDAAQATPLRVVLAGTFDKGETLTSKEIEEALATWHKGAPKGSRILALDGISAFALDALEGAIGLANGGWIVLGFEAGTATTEPFSPLIEDEDLLARVTVARHVVTLATKGDAPVAPSFLDLQVLEPTSHTKFDGDDGTLQRFTVTRSVGGSRDGELTFQRAPDTEHVIVLADPPPVLRWTWDKLLPDASLTAIDGSEAGPFAATGAEVGDPRTARYRIIATKPLAATLAAVVSPVAGLRAWFGDRTAPSDETIEVVLNVRFEPKPATPVDEKGTIEVTADGLRPALSIPFHVSAVGGRAAIESGEGLGEAVLPLGDDPVVHTLRVTPSNANMPATARLRIACSPDAYAARVRLRLMFADGTERRVTPGTEFDAPVGADFRVRVELTDADSWGLLEPGRLTVRAAAMQGATVDGQHVLRFRFRRARLVAEPSEPSYRLADGVVTPIEPLRLRIEADDGGGDWLLARMREAPKITTLGDAPVSAWKVVDEGQGVWRVEAEGDWQGPDAAVFADEFAGVTFSVAWGGGDVPEDIIGTVEIPARWGTRGWIFLGLAVLALGLAVGTVIQLRATPVRGTLLYAVDGMQRTVGRLDLSPIGRKAVVLTTDMQGRVSIDGEGEPIAAIRPTRVGALLTGLGMDDDPAGRLLVDGVSLRSGRHTLRFVLGETTPEDHAALLEVPDLLGPEYDLESGIVDSLPKTMRPPDTPALGSGESPDES